MGSRAAEMARGSRWWPGPHGVRWDHVLRVVTVAVFVAAAIKTAHFTLVRIPEVNPDAVGIDYWTYMHATRRFLDGGGFYPAEQLAGPYPHWAAPILYPPVALWLMVPFAQLPTFLWWAVPLALAVWAIARMRPATWALCVIGVLLLLPVSHSPVVYGNPVIWLVPALALGLERGGWAVLVLAKPSLAPFALVGIKRRTWWIAAGLFLAACLPFGTMWAEWVVAVRNSELPLTHSIWQVPLMLVPVAAWLGRAGRPPAPRRAGSPVGPSGASRAALR